MDGSDPEFNTVLMRSPTVFGIFSVQIPRFLVEIYDFDRARREAGQFEVYTTIEKDSTTLNRCPTPI